MSRARQTVVTGPSFMGLGNRPCRFRFRLRRKHRMDRWNRELEQREQLESLNGSE